MTEEIKEDGKDIGQMSLELLKKRRERLEGRAQEIYELGQKISSEITEHSGQIRTVFSGMVEKSEAWLTRLKAYYSGDRRMSEIHGFEDRDRGRILDLQNDLGLVAEGLSQEGYSSKIVVLRQNLKRLGSELEEQKKLVQDETTKRIKAEEESSAVGNKLRGAEKKMDDLGQQVKDLSNSVKSVKKWNDELRKYATSIFSPEFKVYFLDRISRMGIPNINIQWNDEGIDYVLSQEFDDLLINHETEKMIGIAFEEKRKREAEIGKISISEKYGETKLGDVGVRELFYKTIEKLSSYAQNPNHARSVKELRDSLSEAKLELTKRRSRGLQLVWCGDYSKDCAFICPGFTSEETYCAETKTTVYKPKRLDAFIYLMTSIADDLEIVARMERDLCKRN